MKKRYLSILILFVFMLSACNLPSGEATPTPVVDVALPTNTPVVEVPTETPKPLYMIRNRPNSRKSKLFKQTS